MSLIAAADPIWQWRPHPEVWLLVGAVIALGIYAVKVIGPKAVEAGQQVVTRRQVVAFWLGVFFLWIASEWPIHDIGEQRLYSVHMFQHLLLCLVVPPLFLLATPGWLARLVVRPDGPAYKVIKWVARPVLATIIFQSVQLVSHLPVIVDHAVVNGPLHYSIHTIFVVTALIMWIPVCGPWTELRISLPAQMVYVFAQSVIPTIPAAWLANAGSPVYSAYDHGPRLWGLSVMDDQVAAGLVMKVIEMAYLWGIITFMFFTWAGRHIEAEHRGEVVDEREILEWEDHPHGAEVATATGHSSA